MKLLMVDTSSQSASCALSEDGVLLGECFTNVKLTHSQTILPMIQSLLDQTCTAPAQLEGFGVTVGPGSFTGLRIGISVVKGMAHALDKPCVAISTLEALAFGLEGISAVIAPVLDARCRQVYTALFEADGGIPVRRSSDEALTLEQFTAQLEKEEKPIFLVGDGAQMCYNNLKELLPGLQLAPSAVRYTRASAAIGICERMFAAGAVLDAAALVPAYLRLPQAERELLKKQKQKEQAE